MTSDEQTDSMTASTDSWDGRTTPAAPYTCSAGHTHTPLSRTAQATRSMTAVSRLPRGSAEQAEAFKAHMDEYGSKRLHSTCAVPR